MSNSESLQAHYNRVYTAVRAEGFQEPISLVDGWQRRVDALYDYVKSLSGSPAVGCLCWPSTAGMLADGRMGCLVETCDSESNRLTLFAVTE